MIICTWFCNCSEEFLSYVALGGESTSLGLMEKGSYQIVF